MESEQQIWYEMQQIKDIRILIISVWIGITPLCAFSQSKLQGAGKATKVGATTTTQRNPTAQEKPSTTKKPIRSSSQTNHRFDGDNKYASKGYMEILGLSLANIDSRSTIIDNYDNKLYASEVKYLSPRLSYKSLVTVEKEITLKIKIFDEDGNIRTGTDSPDGFTYAKDVTIEPGGEKDVRVSSWGSTNGGSYKPGLYTIEVWYKDNMLYRKEFRLYSGSTPIIASNLLSISSISFANTDRDGKIIDDFGQTLYEGKVQYLKPKIHYFGKYSSNQEAVMYFRYFKSSGDLVSGSSSPTGFSFKRSVMVKPGSNSIELSGFGNDEATIFKEGFCRVEIWIDGEKLYETGVTINKPGTMGPLNDSNEMNLRSMLEKPMMIAPYDPMTVSYSTLKNSLGKYYNLDETAESEWYSFHIYKYDNSTIDWTYQGVPFDHFYFTVAKDQNTTLQQRMKYSFEIKKDGNTTLDYMYQCLDRIIRDFDNMGIAITYSRKNEKYLKAEGAVKIGKIEYKITLDEYSTFWQLEIYSTRFL